MSEPHSKSWGSPGMLPTFPSRGRAFAPAQAGAPPPQRGRSPRTRGWAAPSTAWTPTLTSTQGLARTELFAARSGDFIKGLLCAGVRAPGLPWPWGAGPPSTPHLWGPWDLTLPAGNSPQPLWGPPECPLRGTPWVGRGSADGGGGAGKASWRKRCLSKA